MSIIITCSVIVLFGIAIMYLVTKNQTLRDKIATLGRDLEHYAYEDGIQVQEIKDLREDLARADATITDKHKDLTRIRRAERKAKKERDDAMKHLETTLQSAAAVRERPDRISVEYGLGTDMHYTFTYDPPEFAEVTPLNTIFNDTESAVTS